MLIKRTGAHKNLICRMNLKFSREPWWENEPKAKTSSSTKEKVKIINSALLGKKKNLPTPNIWKSKELSKDTAYKIIYINLELIKQ